MSANVTLVPSMATPRAPSTCNFSQPADFGVSVVPEIPAAMTLPVNQTLDHAGRELGKGVVGKGALVHLLGPGMIGCSSPVRF